MRTFIRLLITAIIINTFVSFYNSPRPTQGRDAGATMSQNLVAKKNEYAINFNAHAGQILAGSIARIHSLQNSQATMLRFINGAAMPADLSRLVLQHRREAQAVLRDLYSYKDRWLLGMVVVKKELVTLLVHEISIWDAFLSVSNAQLINGGFSTKHDLTEVKLSIEKFNVSVARVKSTYIAILKNLPT